MSPDFGRTILHWGIEAVHCKLQKVWVWLNPAGRTLSLEPDVFFACGSVEETLFSPHIFAFGENVG